MDIGASYKITWAMFFCNLAILLHHANLKNYFNGDGNSIIIYVMDFFSVIAIPAMTWFFFISGYLFFRQFEMNQLLRKWKSRFKSLVIPYLLWNTVAVFLLLISRTERYEGLLSLIQKYYLCINDTGCADGPLWYVFRLCEFILAAPVIFYTVKNRNWKLTAIVSILIYTFNCYFGVEYSQISYFLPIFIVGAYIGENESQRFESYFGNNCFKWKYAVISILLLIIVSHCTTVFASVGALQMLFRYIALIPFIGIVHSVKAIKPMEITGCSMFFYCAHDIVYRIVRTIVLKFHVSIFISYFALITISFFILLALYFILKRYCGKVLCVFTGGR